MTASEVNGGGFSEKIILRALFVSLLIHCVAFSTYKVGQAQGWWTNMAMPRWMQAVTRVMLPPIQKKIAPATPTPTQIDFVEVDPATAVPEPPKMPKFYGANNTVAANPEITKLSDVPDIRGKQEHFLKSTEDGKPKAQPLQPTPPPRPETVAKAASTPIKEYTPGEMASAKPVETAHQSEKQTEAQTAIEPQPQPVYQRPRTIAEAMARSGTVGQQSHQSGGVRNMRITSSLDVKGTILGGYEAQMVEAIKARWYQVWENRTWDSAGKVVVEFRLHPDGTVSGVKTTKNEVTDFMDTMCEQAIRDPQPYQKWPREMRLDNPVDYLDIQFTFYYDLD